MGLVLVDSNRVQYAVFILSRSLQDEEAKRMDGRDGWSKMPR